jgi:hypothetical protein
VKRKLYLLFVVSSALLAETHEVGILGGGSFVTGLPVQGAPEPVTAGFQAGPAAGAWLGHDLYSRWGGEIRYLFEKQNPQLTSGGNNASFGGQAHAVHYALLFHLKPRNEKARPYVALGGGIKLFRGTGAETAYRPLMDYAYLTRTQELKPMLIVGGGVKIRISKRLGLRFDFQDQITPFPQNVIAPAPGMKISGWVHAFVPTIGISWGF